ncbi:flagellar protein [Methylobacterium sp. WL12]|uniref:flagellin N-terminal helical domain-containing protein n=1 Tax=Methylobacterium sp. WL12 TaxID=2603890 RepID=UPI0011CC6BF9|nr:flagellin [Methylobacterium sp. WL12]TXM64114.1 flagellar protein [Methylobacterium sp. WL12]
MSSSITLSAATRQNLLSLQDTSALTSTTQNRLSTGKKVNSALDSPVNFFTSQSLSARSNDLGGLLDGISNGIQTIQAANQGITSIQKLVDQAKSVTSQALATQVTTSGSATTAYAAGATSINLIKNGTAVPVTLGATDDIDTAIGKLNAAIGAGSFSKSTDGKNLVLNAKADIEFKTATDQTALGFAAPASGATAPSYGTAVPAVAQSADLTVLGVSTRKELAAQYNDLRTQIDQLAKDASFNGVNLLTGTDSKLSINFNENGSSSLNVKGVDATSTGIGIAAIKQATDADNFLLDSDIKSNVNLLKSASDSLRAKSSTFGSNLSVVQNRQDFSKNLINVLDTGSANLTNADLNEEAANSQALSTRQSLGISALSLANQAQQGILQLLR